MNLFGYWLVAFIAMASFAGQCGFYWIAGGFGVLALISAIASLFSHINSLRDEADDLDV